MYPLPSERRLQAPSVYLALDERAQRVWLHTPAELDAVHGQIEGRMRVLGYPGKDLFAVLLALEEAVVNAFRHGHGGDPAKAIQVRYVVNPAEVLIEVADQGQGFHPDRVRDPLAWENLDRPCGRGLFLMRAYMSWVSYNREGNQVTLARQRSRP
jgi:serine/threonine-protein kinase RsbW